MTTQTVSFSNSRLADYVGLMKMRLVSLVLLSMVVGFFLASRGPVDIPLLFISLFGTGLVAAGSMTLNQWMERAPDFKMLRTATRPLPASRLQPTEALIFGIVLSAAGIAILFFAVNLSAAVLAGITLVSYLLCYTPLKKKTSLCTIVGAIPGAVPPLIGWAAAAGKTSYQAWILFAILFLWQMPHFLAIAWLYRKDYAAAEFRMLSVEDPSGVQLGRQIVLYSLALLPVSLAPSVLHMTGFIYFVGALLLGIGFVVLGLVSLKKINQRARLLFRFSILYLALLLILMVLDRV